MLQTTNPTELPIARLKIKTLEELAADADKSRRAGLRVVLAHGTFDLLHLGHVRYFEEARQQGDILFVTITADEFVNKGPSRPYFSHDLRAEMVGALGYVDGVAINHQPTAVNLIKAIRPDVYVKGPDYKDTHADVTGNIIDEQRAVENYGGRIHFTDNITFSSSTLINRYLETPNSELREYLDCARERNFQRRVPNLIDRIANMKVLLVGETIVDEYVYVSPLGKPPKENVLATLHRGKEVFAGGVIAAANHVAGFCAGVEVFTALGESESFEGLVRDSLLPNVKLWSVTRPNAPTVRKTRYVESDYLRKLFEVYSMDDAPLSGELEERLVGEIERRAKDFDVVIVTDFGHGLLSPDVRSALLSRAKFLALNVQSNAGNFGFNLVTKYPRADYICLDAPEARLAIAAKDADLGTVATAVLRERVDVDRIIITHGRHGCVTFDAEKGISHVPAFTGRVVDTMGAGDAFLAVTAPLAAISDEMDVVGFIGNAVGAIKVGILGHRKAVEKVPMLKYIQTLLK
ncbi:MAG TPA: PfkB family carbohydrate kinase [Xanthobacteraceae bacterium]|nr:PfkB family carbohydrate kinase [Xanthobacteraceae bacterium]